MGNVFLLPGRGLCCFASWVFVTFDFRALACASNNEQKPRYMEAGPGGPVVCIPKVFLFSAAPVSALLLVTHQTPKGSALGLQH